MIDNICTHHHAMGIGPLAHDKVRRSQLLDDVPCLEGLGTDYFGVVGDHYDRCTSNSDVVMAMYGVLPRWANDAVLFVKMCMKWA
ncbi:MAG: hypothetical protein P4L87_04275 [Formivibrio sp.]|nr:hypothetical protein [Formivibrio sp.]